MYMSMSICILARHLEHGVVGVGRQVAHVELALLLVPRAGRTRLLVPVHERGHGYIYPHIALPSGQDGWGTGYTLALPHPIAKSPCTSRSLGKVASFSSGQQAREQKRSAGRQLGCGDDDFDY